MAGHSKWANIRHKKAKTDAKRGKIFTKLIREITVAARMGGGDADSNPRLRAAIDAGRGANMPNDTIARAVKKGAGGLEGSDLAEVLYEGYGPGGVAVLVECLTDNRNRTVSEVRHAFTKAGGNLGTDGSVAYLFTTQGLIVFAPGCDEDKIMDLALEADVDDVTTQADGSVDVVTSFEDFANVQQVFTNAGLMPERSEVAMLASTDVALDKNGAEKMLRLLDNLEDLDDVQRVHSNADIADDVMAELAD